MQCRHVSALFLSPALAAVLLCAPAGDCTARIASGTRPPTGEILRQSKLFDIQENTVSNVAFFTSNYGIFGLNVAAQQGGGYWPRSSDNQYVYGGGLWFGARKYNDETQALTKLVVVGYDPDSGNSWLVPGRVADGEAVVTGQDAIGTYPVCFSTDYTAEGTRNDGTGYANWPVWHTQSSRTPGSDGYAGDYIADPARRTTAVYPGGPVVLSDEDIVAVYKDTDLRYNSHGVQAALQRGYPLGVDVVQTIYTWGDGALRDVVLLQYEITNRSADTLYDCWCTPVMDFDIGDRNNLASSAGNDRVRFYNEEPTLDLAVQWSDTDRGEAGQGFGYVGMAFVSTPAVGPDGLLRTDKPVYDRSEQLGLQTFRNWGMANNPTDDGSRYDFLSHAVRDGDDGPGDKRFLIATGPFHLLPGQEVKVAAALVFARGAGGGECNGTTEDLATVVDLTRAVRTRYEQSMQSGVVDVRGQAAEQSGLLLRGVYPNPASDVARLDMVVSRPSEVQVEVCDLTGRVLLSRRVQMGAGAHVIEVDASVLSQGVYTCRVLSGGVVRSTMLSVVR